MKVTTQLALWKEFNDFLEATTCKTLQKKDTESTWSKKKRTFQSSLERFVTDDVAWRSSELISRVNLQMRRQEEENK